MTTLNMVRYGIAAILCVLVVRQLMTGRAFSMDPEEAASREETPGRYWTIILSEVVAIVIVLFIEAEE